MEKLGGSHQFMGRPCDRFSLGSTVMLYFYYVYSFDLTSGFSITFVAFWPTLIGYGFLGMLHTVGLITPVPCALPRDLSFVRGSSAQHGRSDRLR